MQICKAPLHSFPHWPQLSMSMFVLTHTPSHEAKPGRHCKSQLPSVQVAVPFGRAMHAALQSPQWSMSVCGLTQTSPQRVYGAGQVKSHSPCMQAGAPFAGGVQLLPQSPQFAVSLAVFVHDPLQFVSVPLQSELQLPLLQTSPLSQAMLQSPQCWPLDSRLTQLPSHSVRPVLQAMPQSPSVQVALPPLGGGAHTVSQSPQC